MEGEALRDAVTNAVVETLTARGWCLGDIGEVKGLIIVQYALSDDGDTRTVADSVESELLNMDLRSIGAKSLPADLRKSFNIQVPKIFQISSVRDVSVSSEERFSGPRNRRLLKFVLTDGHSEIIAIEYSHIPFIPSDVVPGTKVRLQKKAPVHNGIVCLNPQVISVLGGVVQSLYDEWEMNRKYSGLSRSSMRLQQENVNGGPPPFEKLQVGAPAYRTYQRSRLSDNPGSASQQTVPPAAGMTTNNKTGPVEMQKMANSMEKGKSASCADNIEQKPGSSEIRPKEVAETAPVRNQAASQKLLQKMSHPNQGGQHSKGWQKRGKGRQEDSQVFTLNEWEKRNAEAKPPVGNAISDTTHDEDLAWQLQNQLDLEDSNVEKRTNDTVADDLRMSMFNFEKDSNFYGAEPGGRGRGRGRGRFG